MSGGRGARPDAVSIARLQRAERGARGGPGNGCAWDTNAYKKLQPRTAGLDVSTHWTQRLAGDWTNALAASYYLSQSEQYRQPNAYNVGITLVPFAWAGALSGTVNQFNPATSRVVLPSNSLDNPFNPGEPVFRGGSGLLQRHRLEFLQLRR